MTDALLAAPWALAAAWLVASAVVLAWRRSEACGGQSADTLEALAARWDVPIGALAAGITARRRWRAGLGLSALVIRAGAVVVA